MKRIVLLAAALVLVAAACGDLETVAPTMQRSAGTTSTSTSTTPPAAGTRYAAYGVILDKEGVGPHLCSAVATSLPPQCEGLPVVGLDWRDLPWSETAGDTTWATAGVVGTFDGSALVLTGVPTRSDPSPFPDESPDFTSPCPMPHGGWVVRDAETATDVAFEQARRYAEAQPTFAGLWVDNLDDVPNEDTYGPESYVANFTFTSELDRHRSALSEIYGGPLCVSEGVRPLAELRRLQDRVFDAIFTEQAKAAGIHAGFGASGSSNQFTGVVEVSVMAVTGTGAQAWLDQQFGPGTVELHSFLRPYDGTTDAGPLFPNPVALPVGVWVQGTTYDLSTVPATILSTETARPPGLLPATSPDGSTTVDAGSSTDSPSIVLRTASGEERIEIVGIRDSNVVVHSIVWQDELTLLVLVKSWSDESNKPVAASWGIYQCDLDDTGCHLQQEIDFRPTDADQVALVELASR